MNIICTATDVDNGMFTSGKTYKGVSPYGNCVEIKDDLGHIRVVCLDNDERGKFIVRNDSGLTNTILFHAFFKKVLDTAD